MRGQTNLRGKFLGRFFYSSGEISLAEVAVVVSVASLAMVGFATAYGGQTFFEHWFFLVADGWCPTMLESSAGLGGHCFGDFGVHYFLLNEVAPWSSFLGQPSVIPVPPSNLLLFKIVSFPSFWFSSYNVGLIVYFSVIVVSVAVWAGFATRHASGAKAIPFILLPFVAFPSLFAFDRGNVVLLLLPILGFAFFFLSRRQYWPAAICLILASSIKPQYALLAVIFLLGGRVYAFLAVALGAVLTNIISLFALGYPIFASLRDWFYLLAGYGSGSYQPLDSWYPQNFSFSRGIHILLELAEGTGLSGAPLSDLRSGVAASGIVAVAAGFFLLLLVAWHERHSTPVLQVVFLFAVAVISVAPATSYSYYGFAFVLAIMGLPMIDWKDLAANNHNLFLLGAWLGLASLLGAVKIPVGLVGGYLVYSNDFAAVVLLIGAFLFSARYLIGRLRRPHPRHPLSPHGEEFMEEVQKNR